MRLVILGLLCCALIAEEPRQLDVTKPADALQVVAQVCAQSQMKVSDAQAVLVALQTLAKAIEPKPAPPAHAIAPVEAPKDKP
jgi:hypothetical protein